MPRRNKEPNIAHETDLLSKTGQWKTAELGKDIAAVKPQALKEIVSWGYDKRNLNNIDDSFADKTANIIKLFYTYLQNSNESGIRLISRATTVSFSLNNLPLFGNTPEQFKIAHVTNPQEHALLFKPAMLSVLNLEAAKQKVGVDALRPYYVAQKVYESDPALFKLLQAAWPAFSQVNLKHCDPKNKDFLSQIKQHLFSETVLAALISSPLSTHLDTALFRSFQVIHTLRSQGLDLYQECKNFISTEAKNLETKQDWSLFTTPKVNLFKQLDIAFNEQAFFDALTEVDLSHCDIESDTLTDEVIDAMFKQTNGLFKQMQEAFDKPRKGFFKPGTEGRLLDDLKSHLAGKEQAEVATP